MASGGPFDCAPRRAIPRWKRWWRRSAQDDIGLDLQVTACLLIPQRSSRFYVGGAQRGHQHRDHRGHE